MALINCTECGKEMSDKAVACPSCAAPNEVFTKELVVENNMKACPYCAEQIQSAATVCPHCKQAIFATNPGTNAFLSIVMYVVMFVVLYNVITWYVHSEADKEMARIEAQVKQSGY